MKEDEDEHNPLTSPSIPQHKQPPLPKLIFLLLFSLILYLGLLLITFTFTDRYPTNATYTQSGWNGSWSYTFSNVGTTATYTYECTIEEFEQGVTLEFTTDAF